MVVYQTANLLLAPTQIISQNYVKFCQIKPTLPGYLGLQQATTPVERFEFDHTSGLSCPWFKPMWGETIQTLSPTPLPLATSPLFVCYAHQRHTCQSVVWHNSLQHPIWQLSDLISMAVRDQCCYPATCTSVPRARRRPMVLDNIYKINDSFSDDMNLDIHHIYNYIIWFVMVCRIIWMQVLF